MTLEYKKDAELRGICSFQPLRFDCPWIDIIGVSFYNQGMRNNTDNTSKVGAGVWAGRVIGIVLADLGFLLLWALLCMVFVFVMPLRVFFGVTTLILPLLLFVDALILPSAIGRKVLRFISLGTAVVATVIVGVTSGYTIYLNAIRIVDNSNIDTSLYLPFDEQSKIARLDKESTLKFSPLDYLPIVDGAAALFPLYSAIVNATYPSTIPALNTEGGPFYYTNTITSIHEFLYRDSRDLIFGVDPTADRYLIGKKEENTSLIENVIKSPIGREGFVFFTNKNNPVDSLTQDELRSIYSGAITNWKDVGGKDEEIRVYHRNTGSGSYEGIRNFMGDLPIVQPASDEYVFSLMSGIIRAISDYHNHPGAIGYSYYYYASALQADKNIKILSVDGVAPSHQTIGAEQYPLTSEFYMRSRRDRSNPSIERLKEWILGPQGQELVEKSGYARIDAN